MASAPEHPSQGAAERNVALIARLLQELERLGVQEYCVCAGARNAQVLHVLVQRGVTVYHFVEERSAAFFALGRIMHSGRPVAVVTTSGTAVAELYPAVMEAHHQALPLVLVTADRPSRYRGSGAPQAVEQRDFFTGHVIHAADIEHREGAEPFEVVRHSEGQGPRHYNLCLEEGFTGGAVDFPQSGHASASTSALQKPASSASYDVVAWERFWRDEGPIVVLVGGLHPSDVSAARVFLLKLGAPVVAEATSNLWADPAMQPLLRHGGEAALRASGARRVVRLGCVPSWRWWRDLDDNADIVVLNISRAPFRGLARTRGVVTFPWEVLHDPACDLPSAGESLTEDSAKVRLEQLLSAHPLSEPAWMRHLSTAMGEDSVVMLGNSLPIREWNLAGGTPRNGTTFFANRGVNGIDGLVSTWLGLSASVAESWLVVGDLSALYDLGAPWVLPQLKQGKRRLVVINNGGGKIFSHVDWLRKADTGTKRVMENPHTLSFEPWAKMWGLDYRLITEPSQMEGDSDASGGAVWEVCPDAVETESFWAAWRGR